MRNVKCIRFTLKPEAFPEISPETRETLNHDVPMMCELNAELGYRQGVRNALIGTGIAALVGVGVAAGLKVYDNRKKLNKSTNKKKD